MEKRVTKPLRPATPDIKASPTKSGEEWTIRHLLQWTTEYFQASGISTPRLDAEVLLAHVLGKNRLSLYLNYDSPVTEELRKLYRQSIQKRVAHEPVAYLTGVREFFSIPFRVSRATLIPRPETEHLIEHILLYAKEEWQETGFEKLRILDLGTGCGNLPIALSRRLPGVWIAAVDVSAGALEVAAANRNALAGDETQIRMVRGDLLAWLHPARARFHIIVSNPPYVAEDEWARLPPEVRNFEPKIALCAGRQGTELEERVLATAGHFLHPNGVLLMEIGESHSRFLLEHARKTDLYEEPRVFNDYAGKPRILVVRRKRPS